MAGDRLQWTLELLDRMSGPGKNAAAAFERLTDAQVSSLAAARRVLDAESKAAAALKEVSSGARRLTADDLDLVDAQRRARREFDATAGAMNRVEASSNITGNLLQAAFWQGLASSVLNAAQGVVRIGFELARFSAQATFALGKAAFDTAMWGEDTKSSLAVMAGSVEMGRAEFQRMLETTTKLGIAVEGSIDSYKNLRAQGFAASEAEDLIKLGADLQTVVGISDEAVQGYNRAVAQIQAKGKLSAEELMQLAESAGIGQGRVYGKLAEALGVSVDKVRKLQETGKITAAQGIDAIKAATLEMVGASQAGEATVREVSTTLRGMMRLAKSGSEAWLQSLGERLLPTFNRVATKAGEAFQRLNQAGKIDAATHAIGSAFENLLGGVEDSIPSIESLIGNVLDWIASGELEKFATSVGDTFSSLFDALDRGWPRIEALLDDSSGGMIDSLTDLADSMDDLLDKALSAAEFIDEHWTALKWTMGAILTAIAAGFTAVGVSSVINAGKTVVEFGKMVKGAREARAAIKAMQAASAAAETTGAAGGAASSGAAAAGGGGIVSWLTAGGVAATGAAVAAAAAGVGAAIYQGIQLSKEIDDDTWQQMLGDPIGVWSSMAYVMVDAMTAGWLTRAGEIVDTLRQPFNDAITAIQGLDFWSIGEGIVDAMTGGVVAAGVRLAESAWNLGRNAIQSVKDAIGWHSPPAAFTELGEGSAQAFLSSLSANLPTPLSLDLSADIAANDTSAAQRASRATASVGARESGGGLWDRVLAGLGGISGPANDTAPTVSLPAAVGADFSSTPAVDLPSSTQRLSVERGAATGGGTGDVQLTVNLYVDLGGATGEDPIKLVDTLKEELPAKIRAEVQRVFKTLQ